MGERGVENGSSRLPAGWAAISLRFGSRDDLGNFLNAYTENEVFKKNLFASLDQTGVGQLVQTAIEKGRQTRPDIKLGICGEHGGDPASVKFFHRVG